MTEISEHLALYGTKNKNLITGTQPPNNTAPPIQTKYKHIMVMQHFYS